MHNVDVVMCAVWCRCEACVRCVCVASLRCWEKWRDFEMCGCLTLGSNGMERATDILSDILNYVKIVVVTVFELGFNRSAYFFFPSMLDQC